MRQLLPFCISIYVLVSCTSKKQDSKAEAEAPPATALSGKELAIGHCSRCHAFVAPELLPKNSWDKVLTSMGYMMGMYDGRTRPDSLFNDPEGNAVIKDAGIYPESPVMAREDWVKIRNYYKTLAPDTILPPIRKNPIRLGLKHFKYREVPFVNRPPLTSMVKILSGKRGIVFSDGKGKVSALTYLTPALTENYTIMLESTPVQLDERPSGLFLTAAGKGIFPTDASNGVIQQLVKNDTEEKYRLGGIAVTNLKRPVSAAYGDLNKDGFEDIVTCEFGNKTGQLAWYQSNGKGDYTRHILRDKPGAVTCIIKDANNDGLPDVYALMAQGDEGVFLYENQGAGKFKEKRLLSFLPLNGSQHMELVDFNKDGFDDIVYVCGDNADQTPILKSYHGIYIYLNDGRSNFKQTYFYQLNGAYKAILRDYDLDGDLDVAAISFFPDYVKYPEESFIYLKNSGNLKFDDYSFPESTRGRWVVMDAGDLDGDGDTDLALGSFVYFVPMGDKTGLGKKWLATSPSVVVLENTIR